MPRAQLSRMTIGSLLAVAILLAFVASGSPLLHELLHTENSGEHSCLASTLQNGQVDLDSGLQTVVTPAVAFTFFMQAAGPFLPQRDFLLPPGRAPPQFP